MTGQRELSRGLSIKSPKSDSRRRSSKKSDKENRKSVPRQSVVKTNVTTDGRRGSGKSDSSSMSNALIRFIFHEARHLLQSEQVETSSAAASRIQKVFKVVTAATHHILTSNEVVDQWKTEVANHRARHRERLKRRLFTLELPGLSSTDVASSDDDSFGESESDSEDDAPIADIIRLLDGLMEEPNKRTSLKEEAEELGTVASSTLDGYRRLRENMEHKLKELDKSSQTFKKLRKIAQALQRRFANQAPTLSTESDDEDAENGTNYLNIDDVTQLVGHLAGSLDDTSMDDDAALFEELLDARRQSSWEKAEEPISGDSIDDSGVRELTLNGKSCIDDDVVANELAGNRFPVGAHSPSDLESVPFGKVGAVIPSPPKNWAARNLPNPVFRSTRFRFLSDEESQKKGSESISQEREEKLDSAEHLEANADTLQMRDDETGITTPWGTIYFGQQRQEPSSQLQETQIQEQEHASELQQKKIEEAISTSQSLQNRIQVQLESISGEQPRSLYSSEWQELYKVSPLSRRFKLNSNPHVGSSVTGLVADQNKDHQLGLETDEQQVRTEECGWNWKPTTPVASPRGSRRTTEAVEWNFAPRVPDSSRCTSESRPSRTRSSVESATLRTAISSRSSSKGAPNYDSALPSPISSRAGSKSVVLPPVERHCADIDLRHTPSDPMKSPLIRPTGSPDKHSRQASKEGGRAVASTAAKMMCSMKIEGPASRGCSKQGTCRW